MEERLKTIESPGEAYFTWNRNMRRNWRRLWKRSTTDKGGQAVTKARSQKTRHGTYQRAKVRAGVREELAAIRPSIGPASEAHWADA
jgi:hypothetical protein